VQFHHLAMEVADMDALMRARDFLKSQGLALSYEGRRGPGGNPGIEFSDPDGYRFELYTTMDQVGTNGRSRPAGQWSRTLTLEEAVERPLQQNW
jgi:hypothetical protein